MIFAPVRTQMGLLRFNKDMHISKHVNSTDEFSQCDNGRSLTYRRNQFERDFINAVYCHEKCRRLDQNLACFTFLLEMNKNFLSAIALVY